MLVDQGTLRFVRGSWDLARSVDELHIPSSVQAVLAARLDALPEHEKRVAQVASVIGRVFWDQLVAHIAGSHVASIHEPIRALQAKDLLVTREPSALAGAAEYGFRHALIRDVAYESLPKRERAVLHREIARWAERELADRIEEFGELIASHLGSSMAYEDELGQGEPASRRELREQTYRAALRAARRAAAMTQLGEAERWYRTAFDIANINAGDNVVQSGRSVVYVTSGEGVCGGETLTEGDLVETRDFKFKAKTDSKLILAFEI